MNRLRQTLWTVLAIIGYGIFLAVLVSQLYWISLFIRAMTGEFG